MPETMHLRLRAQLTAEDYENAQILHSGWRPLGILFIIVGMLLPIALICIIYELNRGPESIIAALLVAPGCLALAAWTVWYRLPRRLKKRAAKLFQQQTSLQVPRELELTDESYHSHSTRADIRLPWNEFHKWKANDEMIIVYSSDILLNMFPRRWFASQADYQALKEVLRRQIGEPGKPRKRE